MSVGVGQGHSFSPSAFHRGHYAAIRQSNSESHCTLIRLLQSVEAWLVIDLVCPRLLRDEVPVLTLHDSVYSQIGMLDRVESAFQEAFDEIGFRLSLKREVTAARGDFPGVPTVLGGGERTK